MLLIQCSFLNIAMNLNDSDFRLNISIIENLSLVFNAFQLVLLSTVLGWKHEDIVVINYIVNF